jgi:lipopolysaccharide biosynthesis regulator YciM
VRRLLRVAAEHPAFVPAWVVAGDRLRAAGETARARTVYGRGARVRPASVLLERLEAVDVAERRPERTVRTLDRLQRLHPRDAGVLAALVRQHLRANALEAAEAALDRWPADAAACPRLDALRGECARRRGRLEQAVVHLARAAEVRAAAPRYRCRACGAPAATWAGRCAGCGRWDVVDADPASLDGIPSDLLMSAPSRSTVENRCVTDSPG